MDWNELQSLTWPGYARKNGGKGIRNRVLVIYTVKCAEFVAQQIVAKSGSTNVELLGFDGCTDNQYAVNLLISFIRHPNVGAVLAVDECFLDFLPEGEGLSAKHLLKNSKKLIVLKAFTKLYGMAGVRLGYCLCSDTELLARMRAAGQPWAVSSLAQAAGIAALDETEYVAKVRALIEAQRPVLADGLRALGLRVIDGKANYLLFRAPADLNERLRPLGTQVRSCANYPGLGPEWYRTAVRTAPENARLLELMKEVLG